MICTIGAVQRRTFTELAVTLCASPAELDFEEKERLFGPLGFEGGGLQAVNLGDVALLQGFGRWALVEKSSGDTVGIVGLWHPLGFPERELGWDLFNGATGKGYATEAATAARNYAYDTLGWTTLISLVADGNDASAAVAERLGATSDGIFTHERYGPMRIMRHPAPEALS